MFQIKQPALGLSLAEHVDPYVPDYDMDSSDEIWLQGQSKHLNLTSLKFEEMIDKLEKQTSKTVPSLIEAKSVLKQPHELTIIVYDYWLGKRLKTVRIFTKLSFC